MSRTSNVKTVFTITRHEKNAIFIDKIFTNQLPMIGVIMGHGCIKKMMMRLLSFHYLSFTQMIEVGYSRKKCPFRNGLKQGLGVIISAHKQTCH
jgi:hypothetical protein